VRRAGYDKYEDLTTEYMIKGEFADYGIRIDKQIIAFVEVKRHDGNSDEAPAAGRDVRRERRRRVDHAHERSRGTCITSLVDCRGCGPRDEVDLTADSHAPA